MNADEATTARVAEVLAEHEPNGFSCACGWRNETATYATAHRAHVAEVLSAGVIRDMQAAAWDEGYDARGVDIANEGLTYTTLTPNPYRAARIEEQR